MEDTRIIDLLFERSEQAIEALDKKYGRLCRRIAQNIVGDGRDAEECVNDAYLGVWNTIPPQRPQVLSAFVCRIVRNRAVSRLEANAALKRSGYEEALDEISFALPSSSRAEDEAEVGELTALLERFLRTLRRTDRVLFVRRYWYGDAVKDIAAQVQMSPHSVTVRLSRIREKLTRFAQKEGFIL
ncbi:MAG: sigma-70 family RNA polymerase sigma factor [Oscillospiraceae bacterium]|nr:sigma-70 family RNA polymerase sigma factor [Oscillospiraceae bacterium]